MIFFIVNAPDEKTRAKIAKFINGLTGPAAEQSIAWASLFSFSITKPVYCYAVNEQEEIVFFSTILEKSLLRKAEIEFGPLYHSLPVLEKGIRFLYHHYRKRWFASLEIQPATYNPDEVNAINLLLRTYYPKAKLLHPWSSLLIDLSKDTSIIYKNFSKGHLSGAKKAIREGLVFEELHGSDNLLQFQQLINKMYQARGIADGEVISFSFLNQLQKLFEQEKKGKIYFVKQAGKMLGGIVLLFQGKYVRYYKGAADPECRSIPVLHSAFYQVIPLLQAQGFSFLDLWGYDPDASEGSQVFYINKFKKGFGGELITYPDKIQFVFHPWIGSISRGLYRGASFLRKWIKRLS